MSKAQISVEALKILVEEATDVLRCNEGSLGVSELLPMREAVKAAQAALEAVSPNPTKYRLVEFATKEHTIKVEYGLVTEGPIEDALVVTFPEERLQTLQGMGGDRMVSFAKAVRETILEAGWKGEVIICSEDMRFARFEPVEDDGAHD